MKMLHDHQKSELSSKKVTGALSFLLYFAIILMCAFLIATSDPVLDLDGQMVIVGEKLVRTWTWEHLSGFVLGISGLPLAGAGLFGVSSAEKVKLDATANGHANGKGDLG